MNKIVLNTIGVNTVRLNTVGEWRKSGGGGGGGSISYPGLIAAWSAAGKSNDDEDRATLKDLTGNGHDITLNGFAFRKMSGYGGYPLDTVGVRIDPSVEVIISGVKYKCNYGNLYAGYIVEETAIKSIVVPSFSVKISGLLNGEILQYKQYSGDNFEKENIINMSNGIYRIDGVSINVTSSAENGHYYTIFEFNAKILNQSPDLIVEFLPEYPDALVFDGVDDYGVNENMPILTDYTIIAKRKTNDGLGALLSKAEANTCAFIFEGGSKFDRNVFSFGSGTIVDIINSDISYMSKNKYNGITIKVGTATDTNKILLGKFRFWQGAFYSAYLFDRSLDEQEIKAFIRKYIDPEYLLPSEIPTPDCYYDFSQGSNDDENRDTIKDLSGNGNDAVAHNFAWSGMSGYGGYSMNLKKLWGNDAASYNGKNSTETRINFTPQDSNPIIAFRLYKQYNIPFDKTVNFKVSGLENGEFIVTIKGFIDSSIQNTITNYTNDFSIDVPLLEQFNPNDNDASIEIAYRSNGDTSASLELLPEYEGALVFDGIDDYVILEKELEAFKTIIIKYIKRKENIDKYNWNYVYDSITPNPTEAANRGYLGYDTLNELQTNGELTRISNEWLCVKFKPSLFTESLKRTTIGCRNTRNEFSNIALYKFLGFKDELTEEQINAIINLLDRVDEIEVS